MQPNSNPIVKPNLVSPELDKIVVYSKPKCENCEKVKLFLLDLVEDTILSTHVVHIIDCDDILQRDRDTFLGEMTQLTGQERLAFPMVFAFGRYIGGFKETVKYCDKFYAFDKVQDF
jgi:glutaredoxin